MLGITFESSVIETVLGIKENTFGIKNVRWEDPCSDVFYIPGLARQLAGSNFFSVLQIFLKNFKKNRQNGHPQLGVIVEGMFSPSFCQLEREGGETEWSNFLPRMN